MSDIMIAIQGNASSLVGAVGQAEGALGRLEGSANKSHGALQTMVGVGVVAGVGALAAGLTSAVGSAMGFEKQMSAVGAVAGATAGEMKSLTSLALQLGKDTSFSAKEAAVGLEELTKAGVGIADIMSGAGRAALDLAAAGAIGVGDAAEIASNAMNVFGIKGTEMAHVADVIAGAANASAIGVNDYKFSLAAAGAVAATVGISFESLSTAIAVMGNAGIKGSDAGTSLKTMLLNLQPQTKKQHQLFRELGLVTADGANQFFDATGKAKSFAEIAGVLQKALGGMTKQQQLATLEVLFGADAIRAGAVMLEAGADGFDRMAESMGKITAQKVAEERLNNLAGSVEKLKGSLETGAIILGGVFTPALKTMADTATEGVNTAINALEQLPDMWTTIQQVFAGDWSPDASIHPFTNAVGEAALVLRGLVEQVNAIPAPLKAAGLAFAAVMVGAGPLGLALRAVGVAFSVLAAPIAAVLSPLGLLAVGVAALAAAWTANLGGIQEKTATFLGVVGPAFEALAPIVQKALGGDVAGAFEDFTTLVSDVATQLGPLLEQWGAEFVEWVPGAIASMVTTLGDLVGAIDWAGIWAMATTAATALATYLGGLAVDFGTWLGAQAALIPWATVWTNVTTVATALATFLGTQIVDFATWLSAQVALIPWATVWEKATTIGTTLSTYLLKQVVDFTTWLGAQIVAVDWPGLGSKAGVLLGTMFGDALRNTDWKAVASTAGMLLGAALAVAITTVDTWKAFKTGLIDGFVQSITGISYTAATQALGTQIENMFRAAWAAAMARFTPTLPNWFGGGSSSAPGREGTTSPTPLANPDASDAEIDAYIKQRSLQRGMSEKDADRFVETSQKERGSQGARAVGDGGKSFGPMQLYTGGGVGNQALDAGINVRDPATWKQQVDFAIDRLISGGWEQWSVARDVQGLRGKPAVSAQTSGLPSGMSSGVVAQVNQFNLGLSPDEAQAACGPAALAWFLNQTGRMPTGAEARQLAIAGGWDAQRGMYGAGAFSSALTKAGVPNVLDTTPTAGEVGALAASGTPFAISTGGATDELGNSRPGHYYQVQGGSNAGLNVGGSGTALRGGSSTMSLDQIIALSGPMNGIITLAGQLGSGVAAMSEQVTTGFGIITASGEAVGTTVGTTIPTQLQAMAAAGTALVSASTDSLGNVTRIYSEAGVTIGATITDASGVVVNAWGTMAQSVTDQTAALAVTVPEQTAAMTTGVLGSVTSLGEGVLTTFQDMNGTTVATITSMTGEVTSQSATLANGVSLNLADMAVKSTTSVDAMTGHITRVMTDAAGNSVTTVTTAAGQIVSQYATMNTSAGASVTTLAGTTKTKTGEIGAAMKSTEEPVKSLYTTIEKAPNPNYDKAINSVKKLGDAFKETASLAKKLEDAMSSADAGADKGGSKGGSKGLGKAAGGPLSAGQPYIVGDGGRAELFVPGDSGYLYPSVPTPFFGGRGGNDGGVSISVGQIVIQGANKDGRELAVEIQSELTKIARENGGADRLFS